jgi:Serine/Threonine/Tyrosine Kinase found in polyvalent proteins
MENDVKKFKNELQNIICRNGEQGKGHTIKTVQAYLSANKGAGAKAQTIGLKRTAEERALIEYANDAQLWLTPEEMGNYITEGAEQKIHFIVGTDYVLKMADAIFYTTWLDYFNNLLLHNAFFPNTAYELKGFIKPREQLYVAVQQPYIVSTEPTKLENISVFLLANGFLHKKNNDFYHPYLGIILEDLHDENVLTSNGVLFFVDTVFYLTEIFYQQVNTEKD